MFQRKADDNMLESVLVEINTEHSISFRVTHCLNPNKKRNSALKSFIKKINGNRNRRKFSWVIFWWWVLKCKPADKPKLHAN